MTLSQPDFYLLRNFAHEVETIIMIKALNELAKSNPFTSSTWQRCQRTERALQYDLRAESILQCKVTNLTCKENLTG
jgi:hypothetical protein